MSVIRIELPEPTVLLNVWQRMHWRERKRHAEALAWSIREALGPVNNRPLRRCRVEVCRYSSQLPDWDGLYGGLKPLLDCLVVASRRNPHGLGLIVDDSPNVIESLSAKPVLCSPRAGRTVVEIEGVA